MREILSICELILLSMLRNGVAPRKLWKIERKKRKQQRRKYFLTAGLILTLVLISFLLSPLGSGKQYIVDDADAYLHAWNLWWVHHALVELGQNPYSTDYNGYPEEFPLTYHQLIFPLGLASIPLFSIGLISSQVLLIWNYIFAIVGYIGMFLLIDYLRGPPAGAFTAGLYYVLTPIFWQNLARPDSLSYLLFPSLFLGVLWAMDGKWSRIIIPVLIASSVFLLSPYFAVGLFLCWLFSFPVFYQRGNSLARVGSLLPLTLILTSFQWVPQFINQPPILVQRQVIDNLSADLTAWVLPPQQVLWLPEAFTFWTSSWTGTESSLYLGWTALVMIGFGLYRSNTKFLWYFAGLTTIFFLLATGTRIQFLGRGSLEGVLPYNWLLSTSDQFYAFRAPFRFGYFVVFFVAVGVGYLFPYNNNWYRVIIVVLVGELLVSPVSVKPLPDIEQLREVQEIITREALIPVPLTDVPTEAQFGQTIHEKKMTTVGTSYGTERLWSVIASNPVTNRLFNNRELPDSGWDELAERGYGGVIFHHRTLSHPFPGLTQKWKQQLRKKLGPPVLQNKHFFLYQF